MAGKTKGTHRVAFIITLLLAGALACAPLEDLLGGGGPTTEITEPPSGALVEVGQAVSISSTSESSAGITRVELLINGEMVSEDVPEDDNPKVFRIIQSWVPLEEGQVRVSVVAYDADGEASEESAITLNVGAGVAVVTPTPVEDVEGEGCTLNASFVADITIPDDTVMAPGAAFSKGWRIANTGSCDWGPGFELVYVSGEQMGGPSSVPIPETAAGATVDVSVSLAAPMTYGTHRGDWRIRTDEAQMFGSTFWVQIVVPSPATPTPTLGPTDTPPPSAPVPETEWVYEQISIADGATEVASVLCPSGSLIVGGGYQTGRNVLVFANYKYFNGWRADAVNNSGSQATMRVYAVCLWNTEGTITTPTESVSVSPGTNGHPQPDCPAGSVVMGGGWQIPSDGSLHVYMSSKKPGNGWEILAHNNAGTAKNALAQAICLHGTGGTISEQKTSSSVPAGLGANAVCTCSSGLAVGGGFTGEVNVTFFSSDVILGTVDNTWVVYAWNESGSAENIFGHAECLTLP